MIIFISLFLIYLQRILDWNKFIMVFFNFFVIFLEFSITRRIGTKRNYNFYFFPFPAFSSLFWLKMKPQWYFLVFWIFLLFFFLNFLLHIGYERNGTERNNNFYFPLSHLFPTYFGLKWVHNSIFFIFLLFFWNFLLRVG